MSYKIIFTKESAKDIEKLDQTVKKQLYKKLVYFKDLDDIKVVAKKLHNHEAGEYRLCVGNFRIIFDLDKHTIIVLRVQHRKDVYR
jgi:mRNA interferase RelE/StbE